MPVIELDEELRAIGSSMTSRYKHGDRLFPGLVDREWETSMLECSDGRIERRIVSPAELHK